MTSWPDVPISKCHASSKALPVSKWETDRWKGQTIARTWRLGSVSAGTPRVMVYKDSLWIQVSPAGTVKTTAQCKLPSGISEQGEPGGE